MYAHLFGPVPSRRLGMSLGVDLVPRKTCSLDCVYCEVGETTALTVERKEFVPFEEVSRELSSYFSSTAVLPDVITFSGSGEPTLNSSLGRIISFIREMQPGIPLAVLTNGTLLSDREVRAELLDTDVVLPSLDAVTQEVFEAVNRPECSLDVERHIQGLIEFRKEYAGRIFLEVFILPGWNDRLEHIMRMKDAIRSIKPDKVQLNTLDRPGALRDLRAATKEELEGIITLLDYPGTEIIADVGERKDLVSYREDAESAILGTIARRPCTVDDLTKILGMHVNEINKYLDVLESDGRIEVVRQERGYFYRAT